MASVKLGLHEVRVGNIFCIGRNYAAHAAELGNPVEAEPLVFLKPTSALLDESAPIALPEYSGDVHHECELVVLIGRGGDDIPPEQALSHVAGYSCYNDGSIRDWQRHTTQFTPGKNFPGTGAFGPWLVTADEIPDPSKLTLTTRLNGTVMQQSGTDDLIFSVPHCIAYCSSFTYLEPGDVIITGTPGGVGNYREPPIFMKPGDKIEVDITSIGTLVNSIADEKV